MQRKNLSPRKRALWDRIERLARMADARPPKHPKFDVIIRQIEKLNIALQVKD
jgi:hypothetical protein